MNTTDNIIKKGKHYHLIGIGGIGMGAIAELLIARGGRVSGSDVVENKITARLKQKGAHIFKGHHASNIFGADIVIFSAAVTEANPELAAARRENIPVLKRAQMLAELMKGHEGITIAGAHGKTTTAAMIERILSYAGLSPSSAIGGIVNGTPSNAFQGSGRYFVAELDESDGSFLYFSPMFSIITNIDFEHVDYYKNWENILSSYRKFISKTEEDGVVFACASDARLISILEQTGRRYKTYGIDGNPDFYAKDIILNAFSSEFDCFFKDDRLGHIKLNVPGRHNVINAMASVALCMELSVDFDTIAQALAIYQGVGRRFQVLLDCAGIMVIDDYAHHPTEIDVTIQTAMRLKRDRLIAVFEPHRYSRLNVLMDEFAKSLGKSDYPIVTDVYAASEPSIDGITAKTLNERIRLLTGKNSCYISKDTIVDVLSEIVREGDIVLAMGAGDISKIAHNLAAQLRKTHLISLADTTSI